MTQDQNKNSDDKLVSILDDLKRDNSKLVKAQKDADEDKEKLDDLKNTLMETQQNINRALNFLGAKQDGGLAIESAEITVSKKENEGALAQRVIEGVFNGESMVGGDGKRYNVPANYASKSKLVEGDILKLTITKDGSFIYKQIGPIERRQLIATLGFDEITGDWYAVQEGSRRWKLLTASVTYFKGEPGDEVVIVIPKNSTSNSAAVENIIKT